MVSRSYFRDPLSEAGRQRRRPRGEQKCGIYANLLEMEARFTRRAWGSHVTTHTPATKIGRQVRDVPSGFGVGSSKLRKSSLRSCPREVGSTGAKQMSEVSHLVIGKNIFGQGLAIGFFARAGAPGLVLRPWCSRPGAPALIPY